jgi:hypothetical protein
MKFLYLDLKYICNNLQTIEVEKQDIETIKNKVSELTVEEIKAHLEHYKYHFNIIKEDCDNFWHNNSNVTIDKCKKEVFNVLIRIKELDLLKSPVDESMDYATSSKVLSIYSIK